MPTTELVLKIEVTVPGLAELVEALKKPPMLAVSPECNRAAPSAPSVDTAPAKDEALEKAINDAVPAKDPEQPKVRRPRAPKAETPAAEAVPAPAPAAEPAKEPEVVTAEQMRAAYEAACQRVTAAKKSIDSEIAPLLARIGNGVRVTQLTDQAKRREVVEALNALYPPKKAAEAAPAAGDML